MNQNLRSNSKIKIITSIKNECLIYSICLLRDGRLTSGGENGIVIYNRYTYQSNIIIQGDVVSSVCLLRNGNLASSGHRDVVIYEIDRNNYQQIHILKGHNSAVKKVIEIEDNRICSCSDDSTIRIWDKNYQCIQTLEGHTHSVKSIIEINDYIISSSASDNNSVGIWNKKTYQCIKYIQDAYCENNNSLSKLKDNTIILGRWNEIFIIDILSFESKTFTDDQLGWIYSICVLREDQILLGNEYGMIICYNSLSNQIISTQREHKSDVFCIIKSEDNQICSSSNDCMINIYD